LNPASSLRRLCFHQIFEARADLRPEAASVAVLGDAPISYGELERRANRLARHLRRAGVGPDAVVGLALPRSLELVTAMLAILKAGGAYLPLDLGLPEERLSSLLADSGASLLLTLEALAPGLARGGQRKPRTLCLDACRAAVAAESAERPAGGTDLDNLAYVIYTSGSTGRPKGVQVAHRGLANCAVAQMRTLHLGPASRVLQFASWGFDAAVFEILMAFAAGATLYLAPEEARAPDLRLADLLRRERITHASLSPSVLTALPASVAGELPDLAVLLSVGEACSEGVVNHWTAGGRRFLNGYGPTETTICATMIECFAGTRPTIDGAIDGVEVRLLDAALQPTPDGATGEICIGGAGVARGYLGQPALTAARFLPDPWSREPGARLYATGDLARRGPNGLEYMGRGDHQIKIRGQRIELGEIEAALDSLPGVAGSAVLAVDDPAAAPGQAAKRLVAWIVPAAGAGAPGEVDLRDALRAGLRERLPEAMVPALFVFLDAWPLTPNGKLDRAALALPTLVPRAAAAGSAAPSSPVEAALAEIWRELLGLERVGAEEDLLELGAHSLLLARFTSRVRTDLAVELAPRELFAHPTIAGLAGRIERLQGGTEVAELPPLPPIRPVPRNGPLPLSFAQERVWFLEQLTPATRAYNAQAEIRLAGPLDAAALSRALVEIVRRHEVLRTGFPAVDGQPVQVVHPADESRFADLLPIVDLSALPAPARQAAAERLTRDFLRLAFDLTRPPLVRWALLVLGPGPRGPEHSLLQVEHHFVHDGWGFGVLLGELTALYAAFAAGRPSPLPEPAIQYADFALWQRRWMQGEVLARHLAFWRERLADSPPLLDLPTDRPRPRVQSFRGAGPRVELAPALYGDLRALARRTGTTLYAVMLATFKVLLLRYGGRDDVVVGTGVANRRARELETLIGMVVNTIVLRTSLAGDPAWRELLLRVRDTMVASRTWEDLPFDHLVRELAPDRDLGRNPLFQVMFGFHDAQVPDIDLDGLTGTVRELHNGSAKTDLNIIGVPRAEQRIGRAATGDEGLVLIWEHSTDLFDAPTIARMIGHYVTLLAAAVADPLQRLSELPLLDPVERRQLTAWSLGSGHDYPREAAVDELFAAVAAAQPEAVAVVMTVGDEDEILTYGELDRRANRLAHRLRATGVGLETPVGLAVERSPALVVGMLGILKAGGHYVPLDPAYPAERLAFMAADAGLTVVVTCGGAALPFAAIERIDLAIDQDDDAAALAEQSPESPPAAGGPDGCHLAYVMYTSGSTGRPKGVAIPHRGIVRLVRGGAYARFSPDEVVLQIAAASFDAATVEIWGALLNGARLAILPGRTPSLAEIAAALAHHRVTTAALTAGLFHQMVDEDLAGLSPLTQILAGGDVVSPAHVRRTLAGLPGCTVVHCYGPTESTTFTCCRPMRGVEAAADPLPIGRPIAGTRVHLLDRRLQPVPAGVPGELYTGGDGLARGYLGRPELTAEKFVPDPFSAEPGARLYRTGDLARYQAGDGQSGGEIEFLGRIDDQVKIRGFRVEPGEVESVLAGCPGVREAVVVVRAEGGDKRLVAYVTPDAGAEDPDALVAAVRAFLAGRLPDYLVPAFLIALPVLPLTPHGKVDRAALPSPSGSAERAAVPYARPRGPLEERLAGIWADVLRVERVGIHDNFFDLGGHSLLATRLIARVRRAFEVDLPVHAVFEGGTVAGMAGLLAARRAGAPEPEVSPLITLQPEGDRPPLFFLHPVGGGVSSYAFLVRHLGRDQPSFGLQAPGLLDNRLPFDRLEPMAAFYAAAIRERQPEGPYLLAGWSLGGWIAFEVAHQLRAAGQEVALVALLDTGMRLPDQPLGDPGEVDAAMLAELFNLDPEPPGGGAWSVETLVEEARRSGMVEEAFSVAQADRLLQVFRSNMIAQDTYAIRPYRGRLTLLRCTPPEGEPADPTRGWGALAEEGVDVRRVPGTHATLVFEPHAGPVAGILRAAIDDALAASVRRSGASGRSAPPPPAASPPGVPARHG
jgi:amino acid adenylation domain-containing protein